MQCFSISCLFFLVPAQQLAARQSNANLNAFIDAYRVHGHRTATINPIDLRTDREEVPELNAERYGLDEGQELATLEGLVAFSDSEVKTVADLKKKLTETYCQNVSAEFSFIESECEREWFTENFEKMLEEKTFIGSEEKRELATQLLQFQEFDRFMNVKLPSIKRYGGEGSESTVAFFRKLLSSAAKEDVNSIVLGMPHRGKLNALVTLFKQRPVKILRKYKGLPEFGEDAKAMMDIPNHFSKKTFRKLFEILVLKEKLKVQSWKVYQLSLLFDASAFYLNRKILSQSQPVINHFFSFCRRFRRSRI